MKKTYINPNIEVVKIQTSGMLAVSKSGISDSGVTPQGGDAISAGMGHDDDFDW